VRRARSWSAGLVSRAGTTSRPNLSFFRSHTGQEERNKPVSLLRKQSALTSSSVKRKGKRESEGQGTRRTQRRPLHFPSDVDALIRERFLVPISFQGPRETERLSEYTLLLPPFPFSLSVFEVYSSGVGFRGAGRGGVVVRWAFPSLRRLDGLVGTDIHY
jgi:hypothetical protein